MWMSATCDCKDFFFCDFAGVLRVLQGLLGAARNSPEFSRLVLLVSLLFSCFRKAVARGPRMSVSDFRRLVVAESVVAELIVQTTGFPCSFWGSSFFVATVFDGGSAKKLIGVPY